MTDQTIKNENVKIAQTIINQLGGMGKLVAMVGAKNFVALDKGLMFSFKGSRKMNRVVIKLDPSDTYSVEFWKISGINFDKIKSFDGLYWDQLIENFESTTGLYLSL